MKRLGLESAGNSKLLSLEAWVFLRYKEEGGRGKEAGSGFAGTPNNVGAEAVKRFLLRFCF